MNLLEAISRFAQTTDEKNLGRRIADLYDLSDKTGKEMTTGFLSLSEQAFCRQICAAAKLPLSFFGGYAEAERQVAVIATYEIEEVSTENLCAISFSFTEDLSHRDFLGAAMGLFISRENIGDILIEDKHATMIVLAKMAPFLLSNLEKAGHANLKGNVISLDEVHAIAPTFMDKKDTVASLRADCVVAAAFSLSRDAAKKAVERELVQVNYRLIASANVELKEGDVVSVRKKGNSF